MTKVSGITGDLKNSHKIVKVDNLPESYALSGSVEYPYGEFFSDITDIGLDTLNDPNYKYGLKYDKTNVGGVKATDKIYGSPVYGANVFIDGVRRTKFDHVDKNQTQISGHDIYLSFLYRIGELGVYDHVKITNISHYLGYTYYDEDGELKEAKDEITTSDTINISSSDNTFFIENEYTVRLSGPTVTGPININGTIFETGDIINIPNYNISNEVTYVDDIVNEDNEVITNFYSYSNVIDNINNEYIGKISPVIPSEKFINSFKVKDCGDVCVRIRSNYDYNLFDLFNFNVKVNPLSIIIEDLIENRSKRDPSEMWMFLLEGNTYEYKIYFDPLNIDEEYFTDEHIYVTFSNAYEELVHTNIIFNGDKTCTLYITCTEGIEFANKLILLKLHYPSNNNLSKTVNIFLRFFVKPSLLYIGSYYPQLFNEFDEYEDNWQLNGWHKYTLNNTILNKKEYLIHNYNNNGFDKQFRNAPLYIAIPKNVNIYPCVDIFEHDSEKDLDSFRETKVNVKFINEEHPHLSYIREYVLYIEKDPATRYYTNKLKYIK